jgi:hypothetical protein
MLIFFVTLRDGKRWIDLHWPKLERRHTFTRTSSELCSEPATLAPRGDTGTEGEEWSMTIKGVLWRFALAYMAALFAAGYVIRLLGFESGTGVNVAILAGCVLWVCGAFGKANGRYFTSREKAVVVVGLLLIDVALQFVVVLAALSQGTSAGNSDALMFAVVLVGLLHAVAIYFFVGAARKYAVKQGIGG